MQITDIIDQDSHAIGTESFAAQCRDTLDKKGVLVLSDFIRPAALAAMHAEARSGQSQAYFCAQNHSVYLTPQNPDLPDTHAANRQVVSSKGCICDDMIAAASPLRTLYDSADFRNFIALITGQSALHPYADTLSSINIH